MSHHPRTIGERRWPEGGAVRETSVLSSGLGPSDRELRRRLEDPLVLKGALRRPTADDDIESRATAPGLEGR
jgi:hypothetical protein